MNLDNLKKQAKLLVRWHGEGKYSVAGRIRLLNRYGRLTDAEILAMDFRLAEAQEILALEAGYASWAGLKAACASAVSQPRPSAAAAVISQAIPVLFVSSVQSSAAYYRDKLGFAIDFLHGHPAFYGSVSRDGARLHLRFVYPTPFVTGVREREQLLSAFLPVENAKGLFAEYKSAGVAFDQPLKKEPWGGPTFVVRDPDGNCICFSEKLQSKRR